MPLSDLAVRKAKAAEKPLKMSDEQGLYLLVNPAGSKLWRLDYRFNGTRKTISLGKYPEITLSDARDRRAEARKLLAHGTDPSADRKAEKQRVEAETVNTFGVLSDEYLERMRASGRSDATIEKSRWYLKTLSASLADQPISQITAADVLKLLQKIEASGRRETAHKTRGAIGAVFRHAVATLRATGDPTSALRNALLPVQVTNRAALTEPKKLGGLLRALDDYDGWPTLAAAMKFLALTAARPGEVRQATWSEIDIEAGVWRIPAERMKMRKAHEVPLSASAAIVLNGIRRFSGDERLIFPSIRSVLRPLSENAMNSALRRMGYAGDEMSAHGFRATFSTIANESGKWSPDVIEAQLAHVPADRVRSIYNRSKYWDERVKLMNWWAAELKRYRTLK